jgi:hypothetical protein
MDRTGAVRGSDVLYRPEEGDEEALAPSCTAEVARGEVDKYELELAITFHTQIDPSHEAVHTPLWRRG